MGYVICLEQHSSLSVAGYYLSSNVLVNLENLICDQVSQDTLYIPNSNPMERVTIPWVSYCSTRGTRHIHDMVNFV